MPNYKVSGNISVFITAENEDEALAIANGGYVSFNDPDDQLLDTETEFDEVVIDEEDEDEEDEEDEDED